MTHPVPETKTVDKRKIACDGNDAASGHPRVWLTIPHDSDWVECPYCDTRYVLAKTDDAAA